MLAPAFCMSNAHVFIAVTGCKSLKHRDCTDEPTINVQNETKMIYDCKKSLVYDTSI